MVSKAFIEGMPKAELHLHLEGSFEPELMFQIAQRNGLKLPYKNVEEVKNAYRFNNLQEFLDIYYAGAGVLITEQDFYDLTMAYLRKIHTENVMHTEVFFDPQTHTGRGISFETVFNGIEKALLQGEKEMGISFRIILCFLRHLDEASAFETLEMALPYKDKIIAVGLDSSELGNPPSKFERVFAKAREHGFLTVAHAGEEGPSSYIHEALNLLKVQRIDHGNRCLEDDALVEKLRSLKMPLTICPLSNLKLRVVKKMEDHPIRQLLQNGLMATVHSDDPAYFGGYMNDNYWAVAEALQLTREEIVQLARNSFDACFVDDSHKAKMHSQLNDFMQKNPS
jgi:adenosine deaminase